MTENTGKGRAALVTTHVVTLRVAGTAAPVGSLDDLLKAAEEGCVTAEFSGDGYAALFGSPAPAPGATQRRNAGR